MPSSWRWPREVLGLAAIGTVVATASVASAGAAWQQPLRIDAARPGQAFDGIGALSAGGTTRLLVDYPEPQRSQVLDYLFKPHYGASLQMLKVEIGGDSQSTDGVESSHMHSKDDLDYHRGYEWWLLQEAKKRNPEIKTAALSWAFPGWIGGPEQSRSPFEHRDLMADFTLKYLQGARDVYGIHMDYIGVWNERSSDAEYVTMLRKTLDRSGFNRTVIVAKDGDAGICDEIAKDSSGEYAKAVGVIGLHYPSDFEDYESCHKVGYGVPNGRPIWASEESSSYDDLNGAACWARVTASHWALSQFTNSIIWDPLGSYYHGTGWYASSLLTAVEPWSGHYDVSPVVWATAHVTQFTEVGWNLLEVGHGSGSLPQGGYYVTYADPKSGNWTLTVVKISHEHAACTRPGLPEFEVTAETVTFELSKPMLAAGKAAVWYSNFEQVHDNGEPVSIFERMADVDLSSGSVTLEVPVGGLFTVSTILEGPTKGVPAVPIPPSQPSVPLPYDDDFESVGISQEAKWWSDQIGAFEVHYEKDAERGNKVMKQMVPERPIGWDDPGSNGPLSILGMREWQDINISARFLLPSDVKPMDSACVGSRVDQMWTVGIVFCVMANGSYTLSLGGPRLGGQPLGEIYAQGTVGIIATPGSLASMSLTTDGSKASGSYEGRQVFNDVAVRDLDTGFAAIGANDWFPVLFDDVTIRQVGPRWRPQTPAGCTIATGGTALKARPCATNGLTAADQAFDLLPNWGIRHRDSGLCASVTPTRRIVLDACSASSPVQQFKNDYTMVRNQAESFEVRGLNGSNLLAGSTDGSVYATNGTSSRPSSVQGVEWLAWAYFPNSRQLRNQYTADLKLGYPMCLSTCAGHAAFEVVLV